MKNNSIKLVPGSLRRKIATRTRQALLTGSLLPICTKSVFIKDGGVEFLIRRVSSLLKKPVQKALDPNRTPVPDGSFNPFLPYEKDLFIADISDTHVCLLNKYNVIDHHLLIVTREFEDQENLLTPGDMAAIWLCMAEFEGLAFYNGGKIAGASQKHKHLQMIPLPMAEKGPSVPMDALFSESEAGDGPGSVPGIPFTHSFSRISPDMGNIFEWGAGTFYRLYRRMLEAVGFNHEDMLESGKQDGPYNLLFTRDWVLLVPRSNEFIDSISINALGFAGALLVRNEAQMQVLKRYGCMAALRDAAIT